MIENIKILSNSLSVKFKNNYEENFPNIWLRDHAKDKENWDKRSHQRKTFTASLDISVQIKEVKIKDDGSYLEILWSDMKNSVNYSSEYLFKNILSMSFGILIFINQFPSSELARWHFNFGDLFSIIAASPIPVSLHCPYYLKLFQSTLFIFSTKTTNTNLQVYLQSFTTFCFIGLNFYGPS